ncbi:MAG: DNA polymerase III subunit delta, partial [Thomasclavelia spiroformis]
LKKADFLTTKKIIKDDMALSFFEKCLDNNNDDVIFVLYHEGNDFDERKKLVKRLRKEAKFFEYEKINHYKLSDNVRQAIKRRQATIDEDALELLLSRVGDSLSTVVLEVEKLCLYDKHIT